MSVRSLSATSIFALCLTLPCPGQPTVPSQPATQDPRAAIHDSIQWKEVKEHLPDPATATPAKLELSGDVLRARKFDEDAMDYYRYALKRGGDEARLTNKIGLIQLELSDHRAARASFSRAVKLQKKFPEAWNNLGTMDYLDGMFSASVSSYRKAIKLNKHAAIYHANLAASYFAMKDFESAQKEFRIALKMDPQMYNNRARGGLAAHVISAGDRARFCYELAKVYATEGDTQNMYRYLAKAAENGFNVTDAVQEDQAFAKYRKDPQLMLMLRDTRAFLMALETPVPQPAAPQPPTQ